MNLAGQRFGRLTAIELVAGRGRPYWMCRCDCGNTKTVSTSKLRSGNTSSCGCYRTETTRRRSFKHGRYRSDLHGIWSHMKRRCHNPRDDAYHNYGGRGIAVCERWRNSFSDWLADVGERPSPLHTIERIDNNGNYEPGNVRWAPRAEQNSNTRKCVMLSLNGKRQSISAWERELAFKAGTIKARILAGWPHEVALTTPLKYKRR